MSGRGGRLVVGFVALHLLCCGLPLLIAAGAFAGAGAVLGSGALVAVAVLALAAAAVAAVRRVRRPVDGDCCSTNGSDARPPLRAAARG